MRAGLTGGIASGKSTAAGFFRELGACVVNADAIAHEVLRLPDVAAAVAARFGGGVLAPDGAVDRKALGARVFADETQRRWLNALVHPRVRREVARRLEEAEVSGVPLAVVDVPLLVESGEPRRYGPLVLAWCPAALQLRRLMRRDGLGRQEALRRLESQMPIDEKRAFADYIIDTSASRARTRAQVRRVYSALVGG